MLEDPAVVTGMPHSVGAAGRSELTLDDLQMSPLLISAGQRPYGGGGGDGGRGGGDRGGGLGGGFGGGGGGGRGGGGGGLKLQQSIL